METNSILNSMVEEAVDEVASHGWKNASVQSVTLAAFGMLSERLDRKIGRITKPAWVIAASLIGTVIWFIISKLLGL